MKNFKFISAIALTMLMASCDDFDLPNPPGQTNGEPTGFFTGADLVINPGEATVNLKDANAANKDVVVATIGKLENFPADYTLTVEMELADNNNFDPSTTIGTTIVDNQIGVNPDLFNGAIQTIKTKEPGVYDMYARFVAYAVKGTTKLRLGDMTTTYCTEPLKITTLDPAKVMEQSYYLLPCNAAGAPVWSSAIKMNNTSGEGISVYDNPEFALKIDITEEQGEAGYKWMLAPESAVRAQNMTGVLGCLANNDFAGKLTGTEPGVITLSGPVLVTVNVEADSYGVSYAFDALYPLSSTTLTRPNEALLLYTDNYINYGGVSVLSGLWYLCGQPSYDTGTVFSQSPDVEVKDSEDGLSREGGLVQGRDGNKLEAPVKRKNLYWIDVNLVQRTYKVTGILNLGLTGAHNEWKPEASVQLTKSKDYATWTAEGVELDGEFKINAGSNWDVNWGLGKDLGDVTGKHVYELQFNCSTNMNVEKGKYNVTVNFSAYPYTLTLEKK